MCSSGASSRFIVDSHVSSIEFSGTVFYVCTIMIHSRNTERITSKSLRFNKASKRHWTGVRYLILHACSCTALFAMICICCYSFEDVDHWQSHLLASISLYCTQTATGELWSSVDLQQIQRRNTNAMKAIHTTRQRFDRNHISLRRQSIYSL